MLNKISRFLLTNYKSNDYLTMQKTKIMFSISFASILVSSIYLIQIIVNKQNDVWLIFPISGSILFIIICIIFLYRGYFNLASHSIIIICLIALWLTMFFENSNVFQKLDTIVLIFVALSITPLIAIQKQSNILLYYLINIIIFLCLTLYIKNTTQISSEDLYDYITDCLLAFLFTSLISYQILNIYNKAIIKAQKSEQKYQTQNEELINAQEKLLENENKFKKAQSVAHIGSWEYDIRTGLLRGSDEAANIFGLDINLDARIDNLSSIIPAELAELHINAFNELINNDLEYNLEFEFLNPKTNKKVIIHAIAELNKDKTGNPVKITGSLQDITERKISEKALQEEKERLDVTLKSIADGVITTDINKKIVLMNKSAEILTGWKIDEALGKPVIDIFKIVNRFTNTPLVNPVNTVLETGQTVELDKNTLLISKDGSTRVIADSGAPIRDKENNVIGVVLVFRDITEKEFIETELNKLHQLETLGVLAGGLAHDFNNILSAVLGNISLAKIQKLSEEERIKHIQDAETATLRARSLTAQLLTFSKGGSPVKEITSIKDIIYESVNFALSGSNIKCNYDIKDNLWYGNIDKGQIGQVFQNLVLNAIQAMPDGGNLFITAENVLIQKETVSHIKQGKYIKIIIKDTGIGISNIYLDRIFDPYFSTKKEGHGLGLSVVYSIIKGHDGYIIVDSELNKGTTFTLHLPASFDKIIPKNITDNVIHEYKGKILFMDDEESVRNVASKMLTVLGFEVKVAHDGEEAIKIYKEAMDDGYPFNFVILDITVPGGLGGKDTIKKLKDIDPDVKAIISSGYTNDPAMSDYKSFGFIAMVSKPYRIEEMSNTINNILNH